MSPPNFNWHAGGHQNFLVAVGKNYKWQQVGTGEIILLVVNSNVIHFS